MYYTLSLTIDVEKPSEPIAVAITGQVGGPPISVSGGAYSLHRDDVLEVVVSASSSSVRSTQVKISSLVFAAGPMGKKNNKHLSPFNKYDACIAIEEWGLASVITIREIESVAVTSALHPLTVMAKRGRWSLDGCLSLLISQADESGAVKVRPRLYKFKLGIDVGV